MSPKYSLTMQAGGLLWQVSDHLQTRRTSDAERQAQYAELWMFLLHQLLILARDNRSDVRDGAATTISRSLELYGGTLDGAGWQACLSTVLFPLLDAVERGTGDKAWDDSKTLVVSSVGKLFADFFPTLVVATEAFAETTWPRLVGYLLAAFEADAAAVATAAMKTLLRVLGAVDEKQTAVLECVWTGWTATADRIEALGSPRAQPSIEALVRVAGPLVGWSTVYASSERCDQLLAVLHRLATYSLSPEYQPDVDSRTPVQKAIVEIIDTLAVRATQSAPSILRTWSTFAALAFVAPLGDALANAKNRKPTYIALHKATITRAVTTYTTMLPENDASGAVVELLQMLAHPLALRYRCPPSCKYGDDPPLFKTATLLFFDVLRAAMRRLDAFGQGASAILSSH